ncbi:hypothetical protein AB0P02_06835 [Streptomyces griseoluteus]|uniref:hypothetical protein n=1 Tax=Streptomyces griseoluteus TaxID=29306 RepID=UPI003443522B
MVTLEDAEGSYELAMPFVLTTSEGGPYDDQAFAAGMACGQLWVELRDLAVHGATPRPRYVQPEYVPQFDLIAMHYGYTITPGPVDEGSGWQRIDFGPGYDDPA